MQVKVTSRAFRWGYGAVKGVRRRRTGRAARRIGRAEHEVVDDQLRAPVKQFWQGLGPVVGAEAVFLLDRHPGEVAPLRSELVAAARQFFFLRKQLVASRKPLLACRDFVLHRLASPFSL